METSIEEIDTVKLAQAIKQRAQESSNEEELRIGFAIIFDQILKSWGIKPAYEKHTTGTRCVVSGVRKDALYGTVILEFKAPGKLKNKKEFEGAKEQVKKYIQDEAASPEYYGRYFGVILDGFQIAFVRFRKNAWEETEALEVNAQTILRLLEAIRGLKRKPLEAKFLLEDFGPQSTLSRDAILTLYRTLLNSTSSRTGMLFEDWKRVFSQVCAYSKEKLEGLIDYYELKDYKIVDVEKLMFSIHTYYTILMKLLTSEIVTLFSDSLIGSYLKRLEEAYLRNKSDMLDELRELEEGGIFAQLGIKNFLEADYFAWYRDEWNDEVANVIYNIVKKLLDYEPATVELSPERVKDLFKRLYQNLVPRDIRHKLGEYFTPDWLAELVLEEVGYDGDPEKRVLDPACGSGTFLVLAIKKIKEYAEEHFLDKRTLLEKIVKNVQGIDLNPLAVLASKANYIIALADLLRYRPKEGIEIPIYLADSIAVGRRSLLSGEEVYLKTSEEEFVVPQEILDKGFLSNILEDIENCLKNKCSEDDFTDLIQKRYKLNEYSIKKLGELYSKLLFLEKQGKNRIWTRVLKNSFAPLLIGEFDYVVGNPPWINWENLPESYRSETKPFWNKYRLLDIKGIGLGKVKRDMAMLFLVRCLDKFTKDGGKLSFLIPFTVYKTQAGAGFRKFLSMGYLERTDKERDSFFKVLKVHDLVTLYPFEGAVNRTSLIVIEKTEGAKFPIPCITWYNPRSKGIEQEAELEEVKKTTQQFNLILLPIEREERDKPVPIERYQPESPWMQITEKAYEGIRKVIGENPWYKAYEGVNTALNQVYWIEILSETPGGLLITNPSLPGQKKKVKQIKQIIEKDLVYPLVRGRDVKKWYIAKEYGRIIVPHNPETGKPIEEDKLKTRYGRTYEYFFYFKKELENRSIHKLWGKGNPFYSVYDIGNYTFYPYKVVWKEVSARMKAGGFHVAVIGPIHDVYLGNKIIVPEHTVVLIPLDSEDEAHYLAAILNSAIVSLYGAYMPVKGLENLRIPKFDPNNTMHQNLSNLSEEAHKIAKCIYEENRDDLRDKLEKIENEIDKVVAQLYGITDEELAEIKRCLMILKEGEVPVEEEAEEEIIVPKEEGLRVSLEPLLINENEQREIAVKISNSLSKALNDVRVKVIFKDKVLLNEYKDAIEKDGESLLKFLTPKLRAGQYDVKVIITYEIDGQRRGVEEDRKLFVKAISEKRSKTAFGELNKLLGDSNGKPR